MINRTQPKLILHRTRSFLDAGFCHCTPLLLDSYHQSEQNRYFGVVPEGAPGPSSQVLPGCRVQHPFQKVLVRTRFFKNSGVKHLFPILRPCLSRGTPEFKVRGILRRGEF